MRRAWTCAEALRGGCRERLLDLFATVDRRLAREPRHPRSSRSKRALCTARQRTTSVESCRSEWLSRFGGKTTDGRRGLLVTRPTWLRERRASTARSTPHRNPSVERARDGVRGRLRPDTRDPGYEPRHSCGNGTRSLALSKGAGSRRGSGTRSTHLVRALPLPGFALKISLVFPLQHAKRLVHLSPPGCG